MKAKVIPVVLPHLTLISRSSEDNQDLFFCSLDPSSRMQFRNSSVTEPNIPAANVLSPCLQKQEARSAHLGPPGRELCIQ